MLHVTRAATILVTTPLLIATLLMMAHRLTVDPRVARRALGAFMRAARQGGAVRSRMQHIEAVWLLAVDAVDTGQRLHPIVYPKADRECAGLAGVEAAALADAA